MSELQKMLAPRKFSLWQYLQGIELSSRFHMPGLDIYLFFTLFVWQLKYLSGYGGFAFIAGPFGFTFKSKAAEMRHLKRAQEHAKKIYDIEAAQKGQALQGKPSQNAGEAVTGQDGRRYPLN